MMLLVLLLSLFMAGDVSAQSVTALQTEFTHATSCPANVTTAQVSQTCRDLDDGTAWFCKSPALGGGAAVCDSLAEWMRLQERVCQHATDVRANITDAVQGETCFDKATGNLYACSDPTLAGGASTAYCDQSAEWVVVTGGAGTVTLQQAFNNGRTITNAISEAQSLEVGNTAASRTFKWWCESGGCIQKTTPGQDFNVILTAGTEFNVYAADGTTLRFSVSETGTIIPAGGSFSGDVTGDFRLSGDITPATLTSHVDDWAPANFATNTVIRVSGDKLIAIRSLAGGVDGMIRILVNVGSFPIQIVNESTSGTAANRFSFYSDIYLHPGNAAMIRYDATTLRWRSMSTIPLIVNPFSHVFVFEEFVGTSPIFANGWVNSFTGTGASVQASTYGADTTQKAFGAIQLDTGTTAAGNAVSLMGTTGQSAIIPAFAPLISAFRCAVEALSTTTDEYKVFVGMHDLGATAATEPTNGIYFEYDRATAGDFWRTVVSGTSVRTKVTTTEPVTTNYIWLMTVVNSTWTSVAFFSRGALQTVWDYLGTIADANIPVSTEHSWLGMKIEKTVGTTQRNLSCDVAILSYAVRR